MDVFAENDKIANQEYLWSGCDEGSAALEKIIHEKLDSLSGEGLKKIVEVDLPRMLALLEKSIAGHCDNLEEVVKRNKRLRLGDIDRIEGSSGRNKRLSNWEDVTVTVGPLPKIVMFIFAGESTVNESTGHWSCSVAKVVNSFLNSIQFDGTEYGTSELESIARKRADEITGARVSLSEAAIEVLSVPRGETQLGLERGRTKF